jgi:Zn finger protein HypA/HybF involved in hydrogenase expression
MASAQVKVLAWVCKCERCGRQWKSTREQKPSACPTCKSIYWDTKPWHGNSPVIRAQRQEEKQNGKKA